MAKFNDLRDFIKVLEDKEHLKRISLPVNPYLEMTEVCDRTLRQDGPALLFENPSNNKTPVLANLFGTTERVAMAMGATQSKELREIGKLLAFLKEPEPPKGFKDAWENMPKFRKVLDMAPKVVKKAKCHEIIIEKDELNSEKIWQLGVHLKWNILDFGVRSSNLEKEKIALMSSRLEKNDVKLELQKNIKISKSKLKLAKADYKSAKTQYELLSEILKAQDIKYDGDAITIDDLLDSNAKVNLAYAKMISSKYEYLKVKYYIDYLYEKGEEK